MIDTNLVIRELLLLNSGISALVGTRIYCPYLPEGYDPANGSAIQYFSRGGKDDLYLPIVRPSVQLSCWAASPMAARALYCAVHGYLDVLPRTSTTTGTVMYALQQSGGQDLIDPGTGWSYVLSFWEFTIFQ